MSQLKGLLEMTDPFMLNLHKLHLGEVILRNFLHHFSIKNHRHISIENKSVIFFLFVLETYIKHHIYVC